MNRHRIPRPLAARLHHARPDRRRRRPVPDGGRRASRPRRATSAASSATPGARFRAGSRTSASTRRPRRRRTRTRAPRSAHSFSQLKDGIAHGISALSGLAFFLALTILSLFFLLSDGPKIRHWAEGHFGVPRPVAHIISGRTLGALRGYFLGVTIIAGFNAAVVTLGALILGVPAGRHDRGSHLRRRRTSPTWGPGPPPASRCCSPWEAPGLRRPAG